MQKYIDKNQENKSQSVASNIQKQTSNDTTFQFMDNRRESIVQKKMQEMANNSSQMKQLRAIEEMVNNSTRSKQATQLQAIADKYSTQQYAIQKKENDTGLPDNLKTGIENLSGYSLDDVKVHFNSNKPAQLQAHAYAQGTDIHIASGQEKHLPHEAWHVIQQKQGRVKPTMQMEGNINDDTRLEKEADIKGVQALQMKRVESKQSLSNSPKKDIIQAKFLLDFDSKIPEAAQDRETLGPGYARIISTFIWNEGVVGSMGKTLEEYWDKMDLEATYVSGKDGVFIKEQIDKQRIMINEFTDSLQNISLKIAIAEWDRIGKKLEVFYISKLLKNKIEGKKGGVYSIESRSGAILDNANKASRGKYKGHRSVLPYCENHYAVNSAKYTGVGPERIFVKNVDLEDGLEGCIIWYSSTHDDKKNPGDDLRLLKGTDRKVWGRIHVSPWDVRVNEKQEI